MWLLDEEKLPEEVMKYPILYDKSHEGIWGKTQIVSPQNCQNCLFFLGHFCSVLCCFFLRK